MACTCFSILFGRFPRSNASCKWGIVRFWARPPMSTGKSYPVSSASIGLMMCQTAYLSACLAMRWRSLMETNTCASIGLRILLQWKGECHAPAVFINFGAVPQHSVHFWCCRGQISCSLCERRLEIYVPSTDCKEWPKFQPYMLQMWCHKRLDSPDD